MLLCCCQSDGNFRPRLGMGWFRTCTNFTNWITTIFVPAWGWVGSQVYFVTYENSIFSSPLGDGLVQQKHIHIKHIIQIFVPAWGWVGSRILIIKRLEQEIFVPAWGWVGSVFRRCEKKGLGIFVPEWGWVGSMKNLYEIIVKSAIFVPAWGWVGSCINKSATASLWDFRPRLGMGWFITLIRLRKEL